MRAKAHNMEAVQAKRCKVFAPVEVDDDPFDFETLDVSCGIDERDLPTETRTVEQIGY